MSVLSVSLKKLGKDYKISEHFKLNEMACKDGSDKVLYSTELLSKLEELRAYGGYTITINSGYRSASHNKKVGGATSSQHLKGTAADIVVKKDGKVVNAKYICCICQDLGFKGIGFISANAVHVDMRTSGSYRGDERSNYSSNVGGDFYKYFGISKATINSMKVLPSKQEEEVEEMTQEQFNKMMNTWLAEKAKAAPSEWSKEAREWVEKTVDGQAIVSGTGDSMEYGSFVTREQVATMLYRMAKRIDPIK